MVLSQFTRKRKKREKEREREGERERNKKWEKSKVQTIGSQWNISGNFVCLSVRQFIWGKSYFLVIDWNFSWLSPVLMCIQYINHIVLLSVIIQSKDINIYFVLCYFELFFAFTLFFMITGQLTYAL